MNVYGITISDKPINASVLLYTYKDKYISEIKEELEKIENNNKDKISFNFYDANKSQELQNKQLEEVLKNGTDIILLSMVDIGYDKYLVDKIKEENIPVIFFYREPFSLVNIKLYGKAVFVGNDSEEEGILQEEIITELWKKNKKIFDDFGELEFTKYGVDGPAIKSASCRMKDTTKENYKIVLDLKPALDEEKLDKRIQRDFQKYTNKKFENALDDLLPKKLIPVIIELSEIDKDTVVHQISREQRKFLVHLLKNITLTVKRYRPIEEAIITSGGIKVNEINSSTMESKLIEGLFFAGEVIDVDAYTGGFNLQIAFSTGYLAGYYC